MKWILVLAVVLILSSSSEAGVFRARASSSCGASGTTSRVRIFKSEGRGKCGPIRHLLKRC